MRGMDALPPLIAERLDELRALCEEHHVKRLTVFGSVVHGTFDPTTSDVDFIVDFEWHDDPLVRGRRWWNLWSGLRDLFGRQIDLVVRDAIRPHWRPLLERDERPVYEAA